MILVLSSTSLIAKPLAPQFGHILLPDPRPTLVDGAGTGGAAVPVDAPKEGVPPMLEVWDVIPCAKLDGITAFGSFNSCLVWAKVVT